MVPSEFLFASQAELHVCKTRYNAPTFLPSPGSCQTALCCAIRRHFPYLSLHRSSKHPQIIAWKDFLGENADDVLFFQGLISKLSVCVVPTNSIAASNRHAHSVGKKRSIPYLGLFSYVSTYKLFFREFAIQQSADCRYAFPCCLSFQAFLFHPPLRYPFLQLHLQPFLREKKAKGPHLQKPNWNV